MNFVIVVVDQVEFYVSQTKADNHAVREAACACIAELGTKVRVTSICTRLFLMAIMIHTVLQVHA